MGQTIFFTIGEYSYLMEVKWKDIIYRDMKTDFEVSNTGVVRNKYTKTIIKPSEDSGGYLYASLRIKGKNYKCAVHRLVSNAFIPNKKNKPEVNHMNANKHDNVYLNLEWCTRKENMEHAVKLGLVDEAVRLRGHRYSQEQINEVCRLLETGMRNIDIAEKTGVKRKYITDIKKGYRHLPVSNKYQIQKDKYPYELRKNIKDLINKRYSTSYIIKKLNLENNDAHVSLINRMRNSASKDKYSSELRHQIYILARKGYKNGPIRQALNLPDDNAHNSLIDRMRRQAREEVSASTTIETEFVKANIVFNANQVQK